ncbi:MAG TPA: hypothetical protein DD437_07915 [Rhodobiaceae bacterium]|jgi:hypothetical protein|nr:hypothetical protein [Rhodobiaceae bacterium]|tara:strand:+ start:4349 stop:4531 length:183 start_codon:yes stop_codon:yes gene_type:complete
MEEGDYVVVSDGRDRIQALCMVACVLGDSPGIAKNHFPESASIRPPIGMPEEDIYADKLR